MSTPVQTAQKKHVYAVGGHDLSFAYSKAAWRHDLFVSICERE